MTEKNGSSGSSLEESVVMQDWMERHPDIAIEEVAVPPTGIPAYVLHMKSKARDPKPGLIMVHGHNGSKQQVFPWSWLKRNATS